MKYIIVLSLTMLSATTAFAQATMSGVVHLNDGKSVQPRPRSMSSMTKDGKTTFTVQASDGTTKKYTIPYYTLSNAEHLLSSLVGGGNAGRRINDVLLKQAEGGALTPEETALIKEIEADSAIYDANMAKLSPVCEMIEGTPGRITSAGGMGGKQLPECKTLSAAEIAAAPHIDTSKVGREVVLIDGQTKKYRFKLPKADRDKIKRENIDLAIKWSEMQ